MHGLRHAYAQSRYAELTGWPAPAAGGPTVKALTPEQKAIDQQARLTISQELGHERPQVVGNLQRGVAALLEKQRTRREGFSVPRLLRTT